MRFELGLEPPDPKRAVVSAFTIGGAYIAGGFIPLAPYMMLREGVAALSWSVAVTLAALLTFGFARGKITTSKPVRSSLETALTGSLAAAAAFLIARAIA
jgi:predicted membrane protein (TIGR00267 family)